MPTATLVRVGGVAAILAGVLRAASGLAPEIGSEIGQQALYFVVDLFLLLAALVTYTLNHEIVGRWGAVRFLTTVVGILLVRSSRTVPGLDLYPVGALFVATGWMLLSLVGWRTANGSAFVAFLFVLSLALGLLGQTVPQASPLFAAAGAIFGAAMVGVGGQALGEAEVSGRKVKSVGSKS